MGTSLETNEIKGDVELIDTFKAESKSAIKWQISSLRIIVENPNFFLMLFGAEEGEI